MGITDKTKLLYKKTNDSSITKNYNISIENSLMSNKEIVYGSFSLQEKLCASDTLKFGECNASMVKLQIAADLGDLTGKKMYITQTIKSTFESENNTDQIVIGEYNIDSCILTANKKYRDIVAYDNIYLFYKNVSEWYEELSFPISMNDMLESLCTYVGVQCVNYDNLCNGSILIDKTVSSEELQGITILKCIAELNGGFFRATSSTDIEFVMLSDVIDEELDVKNYRTLKKEDFITEKYTKLVLRRETDDIGASAGDGTNAYIIEDNFLLYGKSSIELKNIAEVLFEQIKDIQYIPYTATQVGLPYLRCGSRVKYNLADGSSFISYMLQRTLTGTQILKDTILTSGTKTPENIFGIEKELIKLKGKANVLKRSIEETLLYIENIEKGLISELRQTEENISAMLKELGCLGNYGIADFKILFAIGKDAENEPEDTEYSEDYDWQNMHCAYLWIKSKTFYKNGTAITSEAICITNAIINNIQYCISKSKEQYTNEDEWSDVLDLLAWTKGKYIWYRVLYQTEIGDTEIKESEYCDTSWETPIDLRALLELKLDKEKLISEINASADIIKFLSNRIIIDSDYFKLDEDGNAQLTSGKIGGWNISDKLYSENSNVYINPGYEEAEKIRQHNLGNSLLSTTQIPKYDFNNDGKVNLADALIVRKILNGTANYSSYSLAKPSKVTIEVDPSNATKTIKISGTNAWNRLIESYFGINGIKTSIVNCDGLVGGQVQTKSGVDLDDLAEDVSGFMESGGTIKGKLEVDGAFKAKLWAGSGGGGVIDTRTVTLTGTVAASSTGTLSGNITIPTGYSSVGVIGYNLSTYSLCPVRMTVAGSSVSIAVRNLTTSAVTPSSAVVVVLLVRSSI